jgi:chemotaxis protein methyltransferase CheR
MTAAQAQPAFTLDGPPDPELIRIRDLVYQVAGIFHPDTKLALLQDRCTRRMKELEIRSLHKYLEYLTSGAERHTELVALLNEITINETCFFRNPFQLDALRHILIPKIIEAKDAVPSRRLRIWSAGCSTGEEPYTLRMVMLEEAEHRLKDWAIEILATDLNEKSLSQARDGIYTSHSTRYVSPYYRQKYFKAAGDRLQVQPSVCQGVTFSRLNLCDDAPMLLMKSMDIVFCCNVLIYFDVSSKRRVIRHFYRNLLPHGYLFLGHSESLYGVSDEFLLVHLPGSTAYVKRERHTVGRQAI